MTMKNNILITALILGAVSCFAQEQNRQLPGDNCTSIMVGKKASADGSVITSHTCDSWYRTWMKIQPSIEFANDTTIDIYEGRMHTEYENSKDGVKLKGSIPQPKGKTYRYLDTAYPCLNEVQLAMGETTISGRDTLQNKAGMFMIEELARVALMRCKTAREAILLMGKLIKEYGYGDSGECLTIADTQEVWIFEVFGEGPDKIGGVWAAQRIPDDEVAVSANISRINHINPKDKANCLASDNVYDVARRLGFWDGKDKKEFSFWRAYSGTNYINEVKNYSTREYYIMSTLAPSQHLSDTVQDLPLSIRPDTLVSMADVNRLLGSYYEGTNLDLTQRLKVPNATRSINPGATWNAYQDSVVSSVANPWMSTRLINLLYAKGDSSMQWVRTVAVPQCAYSTIIQLRDWLPNEVGAVCWMSLDNPGQSPRFPIYAGTTELPRYLSVCGQHRYREDAAVWHYRRTNKLATVRWGDCRVKLEGARNYFTEKAQREDRFVTETYQQYSSDNQAATQFLNGYTSDFFGATILKWDELYSIYWRQFWAGF